MATSTKTKRSKRVTKTKSLIKKAVEKITNKIRKDKPMWVPIISLLNKSNCYVQLKNKVVANPRFPSGGEVFSFNFTNDIIYINNLNTETKDNIILNFKEIGNNAHQDAIWVAKDFEVRLLEEAELKDLLKSQREYFKKNIRSSLKHSFMIGADPEVFFEDSTNKKLIPAFSFLPGKNKPLKIAATQGTMYWDGFQAEWTTPPVNCLQSFTNYIRSSYNALLAEAKKHNPNARLSPQTTLNIPQSILDKVSDEHVALGCSPSLNVYNMAGQAVEQPRHLSYRPAGGHMHFGIGDRNKDPDLVTRVVKSLDAILAVACVSMFDKYDDPRRRILYGLAGEYRLPAHGLEYRVLSNAWLFHPTILNLVYDLARKVVVLGEKDLLSLWQGSEEETIRCVNNCDVSLAREILTRNKKIMIDILKNCYSYGDAAERAYDVFLNGADSLVENLSDIEHNWSLTGYIDGKNRPSYWYNITSGGQQKVTKIA